MHKFGLIKDRLFLFSLEQLKYFLSRHLFRMVFEEIGQSVNLFTCGRRAERASLDIHTLIEEAMMRLHVSWQNFLQFNLCQSLSLHQRLKNCQLEHLIEANLLLSCHIGQLHSELHHFEFVEELVANSRLKDIFVHPVNEAHHLALTLNRQIKSFAIGSD